MHYKFTWYDYAYFEEFCDDCSRRGPKVFAMKLTTVSFIPFCIEKHTLQMILCTQVIID